MQAILQVLVWSVSVALFHFEYSSTAAKDVVARRFLGFRKVSSLLSTTNGQGFETSGFRRSLTMPKGRQQLSQP